jgi:uncharacterized LabA/DUF88 family protein
MAKRKSETEINLRYEPEPIDMSLLGPPDGEQGDSIDLGLPTYSIVVDGFHVRSARRNFPKKKAGKWLTQSELSVFCKGILEAYIQHIQGDHYDYGHWIQIEDAVLDASDESKLAGYSKERLSEFIEAREALLSPTPDEADMLGVQIRVRMLTVRGGVPRQDGVDARIATEILRAYFDKSDHIVLVTNDADYVPALELVQSRPDAPRLSVVCCSPDKPNELLFSKFPGFVFDGARLNPINSKT